MNILDKKETVDVELSDRDLIAMSEILKNIADGCVTMFGKDDIPKEIKDLYENKALILLEYTALKYDSSYELTAVRKNKKETPPETKIA